MVVKGNEAGQEHNSSSGNPPGPPEFSPRAGAAMNQWGCYKLGFRRKLSFRLARHDPGNAAHAAYLPVT